MRNIIIFTLSLILTAACQKETGITLAKKGQSNYQIQINDTNNGILLDAANALQTAINTSHQVELPIVGQGESSDQAFIKIQVDPNLPNEASIQYKTEGSNLIISGGSPSSASNAVYELLERELGYTFLTPDATIYPKETTL
ncbi:MAG: hypothetical protein AAF705_12405 [Bacteroidota bacterium]